MTRSACITLIVLLLAPLAAAQDAEQPPEPCRVERVVRGREGEPRYEFTVTNPNERPVEVLVVFSAGFALSDASRDRVVGAEPAGPDPRYQAAYAAQRVLRPGQHTLTGRLFRVEMWRRPRAPGGDRAGTDLHYEPGATVRWTRWVEERGEPEPVRVERWERVVDGVRQFHFTVVNPNARAVDARVVFPAGFVILDEESQQRVNEGMGVRYTSPLPLERRLPPGGFYTVRLWLPDAAPFPKERRPDGGLAHPHVDERVYHEPAGPDVKSTRWAEGAEETGAAAAGAGPSLTGAWKGTIRITDRRRPGAPSLAQLELDVTGDGGTFRQTPPAGSGVKRPIQGTLTGVTLGPGSIEFRQRIGQGPLSSPILLRLEGGALRGECEVGSFHYAYELTRP